MVLFAYVPAQTVSLSIALFWSRLFFRGDLVAVHSTALAISRSLSKSFAFTYAPGKVWLGELGTKK